MQHNRTATSKLHVLATTTVLDTDVVRNTMLTIKFYTTLPSSLTFNQFLDTSLPDVKKSGHSWLVVFQGHSWFFSQQATTGR